MEYEYTIELARILLVLSLLLFCCITDIGMRRIPNAVLLPVLVTALLLNTIGGGLDGFTGSIAGLLVGIGMLLPLHVLGRMGAGDVKLLGVVGAALGPWGAIVAGLATMMAGGILGVAYALWLLAKPALNSSKGTQLRSRNAVHARESDASEQGVRVAEIPYAIAIAAGTIAALAYTGFLARVIVV